MSYFHKPRPNPLENKRLFDFLEEHAIQLPHKDVMVLYDENKQRSTLTFKQLNDQSRILASAMIAQGLGRGDRIVICVPNCFEYAVAWLASVRIGACAILTSPGDLTESREYLLMQQKCVGFVCGFNVSKNEKSRAVEVLTKLTTIKDSSGNQCLRSIILIGASDKSIIPCANVSLYEELMTQETRPGVLDEVQGTVDCEDLCFTLTSSGTTGTSKAVGHTHHGIVNAINLDVPGGFEQDTVTFSGWPIPWGSEAPLLAAAVIIGFTFVTTPYSKITPDDSYDFMLKVIEQEKCDSLAIPQHDLPKMIAEKFHEKYDLSAVEGHGYGGQVVPRKTMRSLLDIFPGTYVILVYASVEAMTVALQPVTLQNIDSEDYGKMYMFPDIEVKVVGDDGSIVPYGQRGLIHVRGPKMFKEYVADPAKTAAVKTTTGWLNTADYGVMFEGGMIRVLGREHDIIHRGDEKILPIDIEDTLNHHQDITDSVIVGVPDDNLKEELCACVIEVPGSGLKGRVSELEDWCKEKFGVDAVRPRYFVFLDKYPLVEGSKIDRRAIKALAKKELGM